jgi:hypothetical protein
MVSQNHLAPWQPTEADLSPEVMFLKGQPNYEEAVKTTIELLRRIGVKCFKSAVNKIYADCYELAQLGYIGRIFPKLASIEEGINPTRLSLVTNGGSYKESPRFITSSNVPQMRIALYRADRSDDVDPILHYLNMSFSHHAQGANSNYLQPEAFGITQKAFESTCDSLLDIATPDEVWVWMAMDVIRGISKDSSQFILHEGLMRPPTRFFGNYNKTGYDIYAAIGVEDGRIVKQDCDGANYPFVGYGGVVAFNGQRRF